MGNSSNNKSSKSKASSTQSRITEHDKAVLQLKQMRDKLKQYRSRIESQMEKERLVAKELVQKGNIERAKLLLKKKKYFENNLNRTDNQLDNLDSMINSIEFAQVERQVVDGLRTGTNALQKLNEMMKLDDVEQLMDDTRDAIEYQEKINELISGQLSEENLDEIEEELENILKVQLPDVPQDKLPNASTKDKTATKIKEKNNKTLVEAD